MQLKILRHQDLSLKNGAWSGTTKKISAGCILSGGKRHIAVMSKKKRRILLRCILVKIGCYSTSAQGMAVQNFQWNL